MPLKVPIKVDFGEEANASLSLYIHNRLEAIISGLKDLHENRIPKYRRLYYGTPKDENKSFPWKNCSNLVVQIIGMHCDTLRARILGNIFEIMPLQVVQLLGDWAAEEHAEEQRQAIEEFTNYVGLEPKELDLYRVISNGAGEAVKFGNCFWKAPWETEIEQEVVGYSQGKIISKNIVKYDGPRPEKLKFEDFGVEPSANTLQQADFVYHKISLRKYQLMERKFRGLYDTDKVESILRAGPDRDGPTVAQQEQEERTGAKTEAGYLNPVWDIYECWLTYWHNEKKYRIIATYHRSSKTILKQIFNFYPEGEDPFEMARLGYDGEDGIYGQGFCEMLEHYQEEISTTHNQRMDNNTLANTSILRVAKTSKLDSIFSLYPNAVLPAEEGEIEVMTMGRPVPESVAYEQLTLGLSESRSGVDPAGSGAGGGSVGKTRGVYSALGTFSVMQAGNRRANINTTDIRYAHIKLGRKFLTYYSHFGIGERIKLFGEKSQYLKLALENYKNGRIMLPIKAANASINRELEKQNDMLLANVMRQHHMGIAQLLQSVLNPAMPPEMKEYLIGVMEASQQLMYHILRNFGHDDTSRLLPKPSVLKGASNERAGLEATAGAGVGANPMEQNNRTPQGAGGGAISSPGNALSGGVLEILQGQSSPGSNLQ